MIINPVQNTDLFTLAQIEKELFNEDAFGVFLLHHYLQNHVFFDKISIPGEEIIGFGIVTDLNTAILNPQELIYISKYFPSKIAHLVDFAIKPEFWSKKYGSELLIHFENKLREKNYGFLYLEVNSTNTRAFSFYERRHFKAIGKIQTYYNTGHDAHLMMKQLERF